MDCCLKILIRNSFKGMTTPQDYLYTFLYNKSDLYFVLKYRSIDFY